MPTTLFFYAPGDFSEYPERRDQRVTVLDYDEVTQTSKVQFTDGFRAVVRRVDIVSREA